MCARHSDNIIIKLQVYVSAINDRNVDLTGLDSNDNKLMVNISNVSNFDD